MNTYAITVPQARPYMTFSKALSRFQRKEQVKLWRTTGWAAARMDTTIPRDKPLPFVRIVATVHIANNFRQDVSNYFPTIKACIDGFVDAGILSDDSDSHVLGPDVRRGYTSPPRIVFTLEEVQAPRTRADVGHVDQGESRLGSQPATRSALTASPLPKPLGYLYWLTSVPTSCPCGEPTQHSKHLLATSVNPGVLWVRSRPAFGLTTGPGGRVLVPTLSSVNTSSRSDVPHPRAGDSAGIKRAAYIQSLRGLADTLETNPLLPLPGDHVLTPTRAGRPWDDAEHKQMVDELIDGCSLAEIARSHKRQIGGIRSRAVKMQEAGAGVTADALRGLLVGDSDYDWRGHLVRNGVVG